MQAIKKTAFLKMKLDILIETHYLPNLEYFFLISQHEKVVLEKFEYFEKQTFRNRCLINTARGTLILSIPLSGRHGKVLTKDVKVETGTKWRNTHWRTIESAYRNAPFFEFYSDDLRKILYKGHELLLDLNIELLSFCLQSLRLEKQITVSMSYQEIPTEGVRDFRNCVSRAKRNNLDYSLVAKPYSQVFGNSFASNLSVIDLLFCCGPESLQIIKSSFSLSNNKSVS